MHHKSNKTCLVRDIAESTGIPKPYLSKIINKLNHAGLVYAKRGYRGGVALSRAPQDISILEVIEAVEGEKWIAECLLGVEGCTSRKICPTHKAWMRVRSEIKELLRKTTLADTVAFSNMMLGEKKPRGRTRSEKSVIRETLARRPNDKRRVSTSGGELCCS